MIWNLLCSDYLLASAILLYRSNHSLGSSASVLPNSVGLTWFDSLSTWFTPRFAPDSAFTNTATFGSNPPAFPPGSGLKPPPNPPPNPGDGSGGSGGRLLLLLFPGGRLLLPYKKFAYRNYIEIIRFFTYNKFIKSVYYIRFFWF